MANFATYPKAPFTTSSNFLARDPSGDSQVVRIQGQDIIDAVKSQLVVNTEVFNFDVLNDLVTSDLTIGDVAIVTGGSVPLDGGQDIYRVSESGLGGVPMNNGNEAVVMWNVLNAGTSEIVFTDMSSFQGVNGGFDGQIAVLKAWFPGTDTGGGSFYWDPLRNKSDHNGNTVVSPTVPWSVNLTNWTSGAGETSPLGMGVWVNIEVYSDTITLKQNNDLKGYIESQSNGMRLRLNQDDGNLNLSGGDNDSAGGNIVLSGQSGSNDIKLRIGGADYWNVNSSGRFEPSLDNAYFVGSQASRISELYSRQVNIGDGTVFTTSGSGSPEGVVTAEKGSIYTRTDGDVGTTLYTKESGSGNTGWVTVDRPLREIIIRDEADLPPLVLAPDGVMRHFIAKGTAVYIDSQFITFANGFWIEGEESTFITEVRFLSNSVYVLTYTGTDPLFFGNNVSRFTIRDGVWQAGVPGTEFCNMTGSPNPGTLSVYNINVVTLFGFGAQRLYGFDFPIFNEVALVNVAPMLMHNCGNPIFGTMTLNTQLFGTFNGPQFVMTGNLNKGDYISLSTVFGATDSVMAVDSGLTINTLVNISNTDFQVGSFFQPDSVGNIGQFQDLSVLLSGTATAYESDGYGNVTVTHSGDSYIGLNVTHSGTVNYNGTYRIIRILGNTQYVMDATYVADEASGSYVGSGTRVTATAAHNFNDFRTATISNTTNYNGVFETHNCSGSVFDIDAAFVADDATGDYIVTSKDETDINVRAVSNGILPDSANTGSIVYAPVSPVVIVGSGAAWTDIDTLDWSGFGLERFSFSNTGVLTHVGISPIKISPVGICTLEQSGGGNSLTGARLAFREAAGPWIGSDESIGSTQNGQPTQVTAKSPSIILNPGAEIKLQVFNIGGASDIEVTSASIHTQ